MAAKVHTLLGSKIIGHLSKLLQRSAPAGKSDLKELDRDLSLMSQADADALMEQGIIELLMRYLSVDQHFEVLSKCLIALSTFDSARIGICDMDQNGIPHLAKAMFTTARVAKGEKQIEKASQLAKILVLYSIDAPEDQQSWITTLCEVLTDHLQKTLNRTHLQETYTYLSIVLPAMWVSMGTTLAPVMAERIIDAGGMPLLLQAAKEVQRTDIKGLPKIIGEKALNLLCACNSEQPCKSLQQVNVGELANYCVETTLRSDWVQSQELSIVLLGRLVFAQRALSEEYLVTEPVVRMIQHALECKSPALRMTALAFSFICSEVTFTSIASCLGRWLSVVGPTPGLVSQCE